MNRFTTAKKAAAANEDAAYNLRVYRNTIARNHHMRIDHIDLPTEYGEDSLTRLDRSYYALVPTFSDEPVITFLTKERAINYAIEHYAFG